jgi:starvation-inducible DNA-binding protein
MHHFRQYRTALEAEAFELFICDISRHRRLKNNDDESILPKEMVAELRADNRQLHDSSRSTQEICEQHNDVATPSLIENWFDETECRT